MLDFWMVLAMQSHPTPLFANHQNQCLLIISDKMMKSWTLSPLHHSAQLSGRDLGLGDRNPQVWFEELPLHSTEEKGSSLWDRQGRRGRG